jgi:hypothetical protein
VQVTDGLFTVLVGNSISFPADLFSSGAKYFLGITVNPEPEMPRIPLNSVAYSYQSQDADVAALAQDLTCAGCVKADDVDASQIQLRVTGTAPAGQYITGINQNGTVTTGSDANTAYTAGTGLVLSGTQFAIPPEGVTSTEVATDAVGSYQIAPGAVVGGLGGDIADNTITADDLGTNSVGADEIATDAVDWREIATDAVGAPEIAADGVDASEIVAGAVGTSEVANGSLLAVDILDEPGVASNEDDVTPMDFSIQFLLSRFIEAPAEGYVLAIATAEVDMLHTNGVNSSAGFVVSQDGSGSSFGEGVEVQISSAAPTGTYSQAVVVHQLFSTSGGYEWFVFLGQKTSGNCIAEDLKLTLIYFPTAHGITWPTAAFGGELISDQSSDTSSILLEPASETIQGKTANQPVSKQELAQVKADMEVRIHQLEESLRQIRSGTEDKR